MKLYFDPRTINCRKVLAGFDLIGAEFEAVNVDYFAGGHKQPEYLAINPNAALPAMSDGDFILWESNAILQYAADKVGNTDAYPTGARVRADMNRWMLWEASAWFGGCYPYLVEHVVKPILDAKPDQALLEAHAPTFHHLAKILDGRLSGREWVAAPQTTIADIALAAPMHLHPYQQLPLEPYPNLRAWMSRVEALPCWQRTDVAPLLGLS